jgi:hypothetical protein
MDTIPSIVLKTGSSRRGESKKKKDWIAKGGYDTVIMVTPTPGGKLAK